MGHDGIRSILAYVPDDPVLKNIIRKAADYAAQCGHDEVSDWHCFPVLLSEYPLDPATSVALQGLAPCIFTDQLVQMVSCFPETQAISGATFLLWRLVHRIYADERDVLHVGHIEPAHVYLALLSRANGVVHSLYQMLGVDIRLCIRSLVGVIPMKKGREYIVEYYEVLYRVSQLLAPPARDITT